MPSLPSASTGGRAASLCLASLLPLSLLLLCLGCSCVGGASLREHRLRGSEADPQWGDAHQTPNADMVKALEYIQGLRQRSRTDAPGDGRVGDGERLRAVMRLASDPAKEEEEEEGDRREDKSEELLQAVLSTLQQTEKSSKAALPRAPSIGGQQKAITPHKKLPLMFEDEDEEGEGDEEEEDEEEEEGDDEGARDSPFKRTNENVEEKYTPQNLATLQSVFDELDKLTGGKAARKRQDEEDATVEEDDGEDIFKLRSAAAYDDEDAAEWRPLRSREEEDEEEEEDDEEEDAKREFDRGLDYAYDENEDEDGESYLTKRSKDPDDVTKLVDYYLLKVLERTEEEEQKRAIEEEEEQQRAERRAAQYGEGIDPSAIYQLIQISQKYQIPPEDLLDMMRSGEPAKSTKKTHSIPEAKFYSRRLPERQKDLRTQEILSILGLGDAEDAGQAPPARKQYKSPPSWLRAPPAGRPGKAAPTQRRPPPAAQPKDYDDTVDEDELAAYLAAQMLARYPVAGRSRAGLKREEAGPSTFEQAIQDYFDQMDSDKELNEKRQSEDEERGGDTPSRAFDNEAVMKLLSYLKPETDESDAKTAQGI